MGSFWHPTFDFFWSQIAPWATPVADSSTCVAHRCSLKMLCLLEFQAHNVQVAAVLLPNLCISNRLLSNVAVQPPAMCSLMTFLLKHKKPLCFLSKNGTYPEDRLWGRALLGPKTTLVGPWRALIILLNANKFAMSRPKMHSSGFKCISYSFHRRCYA